MRTARFSLHDALIAAAFALVASIVLFGQPELRRNPTSQPDIVSAQATASVATDTQ